MFQLFYLFISCVQLLVIGWEKEDSKEKKTTNRKGKEREGKGSVGTRRKKNDPSRTKWLGKVILAGLLGRAQSMIAIGILTREATPFQNGEWGLGAPANMYNPMNIHGAKTASKKRDQKGGVSDAHG